MTFEVLPVRFSFVAIDNIVFPPGKASNILRGAFGTIFQKSACASHCRNASTCDSRNSCVYARIFETSHAGAGPSGLVDCPRPFVFRASHLDGRTIGPGEPFHFDLHLFITTDPDVLSHFVRAFTELIGEGLGTPRGRAELLSAAVLNKDHEIGQESRPLVISLKPTVEPIRRMAIDFKTPTELKAEAGLVASPDFSAVFARARDRVATLRSLYGSGPLSIDFLSLGERARNIKMARCNVKRVDVERRSSRTGQTHSLGGFIGEAEYEGDLNELYPFLKAAEWTGVGRQTVWGKGEILCKTLPSGKM